MKRPYNRFGYVTDHLLADWGMKDRAFEQTVEERWAEAVGGFLAGLTFPTGFKRGVLYVGVGNSALLQELFYQKPKLLEKVQAFFGPTVRDVKLGLRARDPGPAAKAARQVSHPPLPPDLQAKVEESLREVEDPDLRASLEKIFTHAAQRTARHRKR